MKNAGNSTVKWTSAFPARLKELRKEHQLTQEIIARLLDVGQRTYAAYELGRIRVPVDSLIRLARFYDTDMNYICSVSQKKASFPKE